MTWLPMDRFSSYLVPWTFTKDEEKEAEILNRFPAEFKAVTWYILYCI